MNNNLEEIVEKINKLTKRANVVVEDIPENSRPAWLVTKRQAQDSIDELTIKYKQTLLNNLRVVIIQSNDPNKLKTYLKGVRKEDVTLSFDSQTLYRRLAQYIYPYMGNSKQYSVNCASHLLQALNSEARKAGISHVPNLDYKQVSVNSVEAMTTLVKNIVRGKYGDDFNYHVLRTEMLKRGVEIFHTNNVFPVILTDVSESEVQSFSKLFSKSIVVNLNDVEKIDKKFVINSLQDLVTTQETSTETNSETKE